MRSAGSRWAVGMLGLALAGAAAGCADPYYGNGYRYGPNYYGPNYAYASGGYYPPPRTYSDRYYYSSKWDYYRNYQGSFHPGPEQYP